MAINKNKRKRIYAKSGGHCWYCPNDLEEGKWDVDHVIPQKAYDKDLKCLIVDGKPFREYSLNNIKNLVPSCIACNLWKGHMTIEEFRQSIMGQPAFRRDKSSGFRIAEKFGLIKVIEKPIVFWFERQRQKRLTLPEGYDGCSCGWCGE